MRGEVRNALWNCGKGIARLCLVELDSAAIRLAKTFSNASFTRGDEAGVGAEVCSQANGIERKSFVRR